MPGFAWPPGRRLALAAVVLMLAAGPAPACTVCISLPQHTVADRVLEAVTVALAREDPEKPFTFRVTEVLVGEPGARPIPFLVDSVTRRRLSAAPGDGVLLVVDRAGEWQRLAYVDAGFRAVLDRLISEGPAWSAPPAPVAFTQRGTTGRALPAERLAFFGALHDHPTASVRELAMAELARAPYAAIRQIRARLGVREIAGVLDDPKWIEWAPVHILLLGVSEDPGAAAYVRRRFEDSAARGADTFLAAWATALIEIDGLSAVERIEALYLRDPARGPGEVRAAMTALEVQALDGAPDVKTAAAAALARAVGHRPDLAGFAAVPLGRLGDWSKAEALAEILESGRVADPEQRFAIVSYLYDAERGRAATAAPAGVPPDGAASLP